ncbi:MAG: hypothetical protein NW237_14845 [Cyanobacteriota bacterium]|nr:hypothetical protein [Cyanobacteriota bacterium]
MPAPIRILLQTTIPSLEDDWHIGRFALLHRFLAGLTTPQGDPLCQVTSRDRQVDGAGNDPVLSQMGSSPFDELWLFAVDTGDGLSEADCQGITAFRQRGGGLLTTRDHQDLGSSLCQLSGACHPIGMAHFFHSQNPDPDPSRHCRDDQATSSITWPNYHSGRNGDYQVIHPSQPLHELLHNPDSPSGAIQYFPAHPHEGAVGIPQAESSARVIATGKSLVSERLFNLAVAFERVEDAAGRLLGRAVAQSTFHHFCDYNWDPSMGCPSFVSEPAGDSLVRDPLAMADVYAYMKNLALWLSPQE